MDPYVARAADNIFVCLTLLKSEYRHENRYENHVS